MGGRRGLAKIFIIGASADQPEGKDALLHFTAVELQNSSRNNVEPLVFTYLNLIGELIKWTVSQKALYDFISAQGFKLIDRLVTEELIALYVNHSSNYIYYKGKHFGSCKFSCAQELC